jgi:hypothetical protein
MHGCLRLATLLTAAILAVPAAAAASPPSQASPFPAVSGSVRTILVDGNTAYIGGQFGAIGHPTGPMAVFSRTDGRLLQGFTGIAGNEGSNPGFGNPTISAVEPDGAGGWYASGHFAHADGLERWSIVHVLADGRIDPAFRADTERYVHALALHGDTLWVSGSFSSISGQERFNIAALAARTGAVLPPKPRVAGSVGELTLAGDRLYIGGSFSEVDGQSRSFAAALDPDSGALLPWSSEMIGNSVGSITVDGDTVYLGGNFWVAGAASRWSAAAVRASDGTALPVDFELDEYSSVGDIAVTGDTVLLAGTPPPHRQ